MIVKVACPRCAKPFLPVTDEGNRFNIVCRCSACGHKEIFSDSELRRLMDNVSRATRRPTVRKPPPPIDFSDL